MSKRGILSIAFKILGVVCLIKTIAYIPMLMASLLMLSSQSSILSEIRSLPYITGLIMGPVLMIAMVFVLLRFGDVLSQKLVPVDERFSVLDLNQWQKPIFTLSLKITGIFCFIKGIPLMISALTNLALRAIQQEGMYMRFSIHSSSIIGSIIYLILGIYLFCGGKWLVKIAFKEKTGLKNEK